MLMRRRTERKYGAWKREIRDCAIWNLNVQKLQVVIPHAVEIVMFEADNTIES